MAADVQTNLRLPAELKEALLAAAARNNRSLSAEVIFRLVHSFSYDAGLLQPSEPEEMRREKQMLELRLEVLQSRLSMLEVMDVMRSDQFYNSTLAKDAAASKKHDSDGVSARNVMRALREQVQGIEARLREIETDLRLPEVPSAITKLAHLMPK